ncbi:MAG: IbrB [Anaerolinea sp.]|nr:IbrB [Anaerolinea sp.]
MFDDPINRIEWRHVDSLNPNSYNPNVVLRPELRLLERSILETGWTQPLLVSPDGTIIDGYHRYRLSKDSPYLQGRYAGMVPCAVLNVDRAEAIVLTVRMNRAKGVHGAVKMHAVVRELIDDLGMSAEAVGIELGATREEIETLYAEGVFAAKRVGEWTYSKAWYPVESGTDQQGRKRARLEDVQGE